ncbi:hypothetical protein AAFF_G00434990 [Aldrovandia affinis]|uniref:Uncharacterized protein n=1 Tax=Aldrovandia affinis TaxID=143900 RepID=A0AAD7S8A5_9TELE|nr:hypothetical protein AAFF_G00434990 [Aldrovandia affinis]
MHTEPEHGGRSGKLTRFIAEHQIHSAGKTEGSSEQERQPRPPAGERRSGRRERRRGSAGYGREDGRDEVGDDGNEINVTGRVDALGMADSRSRGQMKMG